MTTQPEPIAEDAPVPAVDDPGPSGVDAGPQDDYEEDEHGGVPV